MIRILTRLALASILFTAGACGGGGGGGGDDTARGAGAPTGVRVLHGAIEGPPVQIMTSLDSRTVASPIFFAEQGVHQRLSVGQQTLTVAERSSPGTVFSQHAVDVSDGQRFSLLLFNFPDSGEVRSLLVEDSVPELEGGEGALRIANAATRASSVSISISSAELGVSVQDQVPFGGVGLYVTLPQGTYQVVIRRTVDNFPLDSRAVSVGAGAAKTILIAGEIGFFTTGLEFSD